MSLDQDDKEIDIQLEKLFLFLDQFDCWWISDISYDYKNDPNVICDSSERVEFGNNVKDLLEDK